ncbi:MAG: carbon-nitrogen hydrolase family protein [Pseudomonadota bacterium]
MSGASSFRVACVQNCAGPDIDENLAAVEDAIRKATDEDAALVCLPENFSCLHESDGSYLEDGYTEDNHPALPRLASLAAERDVWLLLGSLTIALPDGRLNNRCVLLDNEGRIQARYNKIHLFDVTIRDGQSYKESALVAPGGEQVVAEVPWGKLGLTICYDVRFPHLYRDLAKAGAHFLTVPAAFTAKTGAAHWHSLLRARAIETGCYVFAPGQCGRRSWGRATFGHSLIIDPWGEVLADGGEESGYVIADVDVDEVDRVRTMIPALTHDRPYA